MSDAPLPSLPSEPSTTTRRRDRATPVTSLAKSEVRKLHFVLQGKGGVGKTLVALLLSQYLQESGQPVRVVDTDPVNSTMSNLSFVEAEHVAIFQGKKVDTKALDGLVQRLLTEDAHFVVDNGAASFVPVSTYLLENGVAELAVEHGRELVVHTVVTGGPGMLDTLKGLASVLKGFPESVRVVVWLNDYFGPIENKVGQPFEELPAYRDNAERLGTPVRLRSLSDEATSDLRDMIGKRLTFAAALAPDGGGMLLVQRSRLFRVRAALWSQFEEVL